MPKIFQPSKQHTTNLGRNPLEDPNVAAAPYRELRQIGKGLTDVSAFVANTQIAINKHKSNGELANEELEMENAQQNWKNYVSNNLEAPETWNDEWNRKWGEYTNQSAARADKEGYSEYTRNTLSTQIDLYKKKVDIEVSGVYYQGVIAVNNARLEAKAEWHARNDRWESFNEVVDQMDLAPGLKGDYRRSKAGEGIYAMLQMQIGDLENAKLSEIEKFRKDLMAKNADGNFIMGEREEGGVSFKGRKTLESRLESMERAARRRQVSVSGQTAKAVKNGKISVPEIEKLVDLELLDRGEGEALIKIVETRGALQSKDRELMDDFNELLNFSVFRQELDLKDRDKALKMIAESNWTKQTKIEAYEKWMNVVELSITDGDEDQEYAFGNRELKADELTMRRWHLKSMRQQLPYMNPLAWGEAMRVGMDMIFEEYSQKNHGTLEEVKDKLLKGPVIKGYIGTGNSPED